jgi:hypothetical protein
VNLSGFIPSCCICQKSYIAFLGCLSFKYLLSFLFHAKIFNCTVPGAIAAISAATQGGFCQSLSQSVSFVFLCSKYGYLSFVYKQKFRSSW